ncbi:hypothetical protein A7981_07980 [Methylovorus sp. MM2]|uniref:FlxA-like family protein n=1 Tax=Methylovorus sp. MM2 TaxID=1848038 RepID=UPI0007DF12CA|nr:FlxA-like family protein [Methylovorus sp. MM2]OAM51432.1 hypothetical protein A7981_07980 [Methylovorus sp. MM2]
MASPVSVSGATVVSQASDASSGGGNSNTIAGLKKKLMALVKELKTVLGAPDEQSIEKAKLIQMQIQLVQAQIDQLVREQAQEAAKQQDAAKKNQPDASSIETPKRLSDHNIGNHIDEFV